MVMFAGPVVSGAPIGFEEVHPSYDAFDTCSTSCSFVTKLKARKYNENNIYIYKISIIYHRCYDSNN